MLECLPFLFQHQNQTSKPQLAEKTAFHLFLCVQLETHPVLSACLFKFLFRVALNVINCSENKFYLVRICLKEVRIEQTGIVVYSILFSILKTRNVSHLEGSFFCPKSQPFQAFHSDSGVYIPSLSRFDLTISDISFSLESFLNQLN